MAAIRSLTVSLGTRPGWPGWTAVTSPVAVTLKAVQVTVTANSRTRYSGKIAGRLEIAGGTVALACDLPWDNGGFTLAFDPGEQRLALPSVGDLVAYLVPECTLPAAVATIGNALSLDHLRFDVTVTRSVTTVRVGVRAADDDHAWTLVPGGDTPRLALQRLSVVLESATGRPAQGVIAGAVVVGTGALPLRVTMQRSWSSWTVTLDTSAAPATLPTVGDLVALLSTTLAAALPAAIADLGRDMALQRFTVTVAEQPASWSIDGAIGTAAGWSGWAPIPGFGGLRFTSAGLAATRSSTEPARVTVDLTAELLGQTVVFSLVVPGAQLVATIPSGRLTLKALAQYILPSVDPWPAFLENIGLLESTLTVDFRAATLVVVARLARNVDLGPAGKLKDVGVTAGIGRPGDPSVCLTATWVTITGSELPGRYCHPFDRFRPPGGEPVDHFPPSVPPPGGAPFPGIVAAIGAMLAAGMTIAETATGALWTLGATAAEAAGALLAETGLADLPAIAEALGDAYSALKGAAAAAELAGALQGAATLAGVTVTAGAVVGALVAADAGITAAQAAAAVGARYSLDAAGMARALAGGFDAPAISPVLRATYTTSPQQTMQLLAAAFAPAVVQPAIMLHALAVAPFTPVQVVGPFTAAYPNPGWTATDLGSALVQAGFLPAIDAASLAESLRAATFDAGQALAALRALFPADVDTDEKAAALLRAAGYDLPAGAGEYTTTTEWWGDYFSPLVVDVAGGITIAGTSVDARRDPNTGTVTFDWTDIKTTRASGSITFVTRAGKQVFFGWIRPRPQDGPVSFTGEGRPAPVRWAGTYAVATKWGGSAGQWRPAGNLGVDPAGGVSIDSHTIAAPVWTGAAVSWAGEDNPFRAEIEFRDGCDDPYYFPEPVHGPCFVGRQQSGSAGWVDFRGVVVQG